MAAAAQTQHDLSLRPFPMGAAPTETLDADVERQLALRLRDEGDSEALRCLVEANLRVVVRVASRYRGLAPAADLVQEGNLGLLDAVRRFDPDHGTRLSTFAVWWIRAKILRYLERNRGAVRMTTTKARSRLFYQLSRTRQRLLAAGVEPTAERIAQSLSVDVADVELMLQASRPDVALDAPGPLGDEGRSPLVDRMAADTETPDVRMESDELGTVLREKLAVYGDRLRGREKELFEARLLTEDPPSLRELGDRWGLTGEAARRLELRVLAPLRRFLVRELGDAVPEHLRRLAHRRQVTAFA
jgi:RNA polymerase sigma-32 factor